MKNSKDFENLEEEASRLAKEFPTLTGAILWVITMIDDHHYKIDLLRDALVRLSTTSADGASQPTSSDIYGALEAVRNHLDLNETQARAEEAINSLPPLNTGKDDDDPTVH